MRRVLLFPHFADEETAFGSLYNLPRTMQLIRFVARIKPGQSEARITADVSALPVYKPMSTKARGNRCKPHPQSEPST